MVTMIMARNLEIPEIHKFEAMLKWAKNYIKNQGYQNKSDAKADFRACMDRLSRDLKLYRISPQVKMSNFDEGHFLFFLKYFFSGSDQDCPSI